MDVSAFGVKSKSELLEFTQHNAATKFLRILKYQFDSGFQHKI